MNNIDLIHNKTFINSSLSHAFFIRAGFIVEFIF